jgi:serine/threonine-protein kinase
VNACPTCKRLFVDTQLKCPLDDTRLDEADLEAVEPARLGQVVGSYRLVGLLAEGGMGSIYIGAHTRLNRYVAIKLLRRELQHRKDHLARFFDEARTVNKIKQPNIIEVIDLVEDPIAGAYLVLELLRGPDLKARMARGPLQLESALHIGAQVADALSAVHQLGIVHRDLKPDNVILIERSGREDFVKLIDFGVAQISEEDATGIPFGTAAYMSPEQGAGDRVDGRADVYALGVLLYEMATGRHPFPSETDNEYLLRHADDTPVRPSKLVPRRELPRALDTVILRCLAKSPDERYASAAAVAVALRAIDPHDRRRGGAAKWVAALTLLGGGAAAAYFVPPYLEARARAGEPATAPDQVAPAPAPEPVPVPVPVEPAPAPVAETVKISFVSKPDGAQVFRTGESIPLGVAPFAAELPRSQESRTIRFELDGYKPVEVEVAMARSDTVVVALEAVPRAPDRRDRGPRPDRPRSNVHREGVMDPFAN